MGVLPRFEDFGLTVPLLNPKAEDAASVVDQQTPLGHDLGYDPLTNDLVLGPDGDLEISTEQAALVSWLTIAMNTIRGADLCYSPDFGSDMNVLIGSGFPSSALATQIEAMLRETLLRHDRIVGVSEVQVMPPEDTGDPVFFFAVPVLDDSARIALQGVVGG
jgi:phage baseplate assembly protein W